MDNMYDVQSWDNWTQARLGLEKNISWLVHRENNEDSVFWSLLFMISIDEEIWAKQSIMPCMTFSYSNVRKFIRFTHLLRCWTKHQEILKFAAFLTISLHASPTGKLKDCNK